MQLWICNVLRKPRYLFIQWKTVIMCNKKRTYHANKASNGFLKTCLQPFFLSFHWHSGRVISNKSALCRLGNLTHKFTYCNHAHTLYISGYKQYVAFARVHWNYSIEHCLQCWSYRILEETEHNCRTACFLTCNANVVTILAIAEPLRTTATAWDIRCMSSQQLFGHCYWPPKVIYEK